jgi:hypothetical protein
MDYVSISTQRILQFSKHLSKLNKEFRKGEYTTVILYTLLNDHTRLRYEVSLRLNTSRFV